MKLAMVTGSASRNAGGLFHSVRSLATEVAREQVDVSVHSIHDSHTDDDLSLWYPLRPIAYPAVGPRGVGFAPRLSAALLAGEHDLVHIHGIWQFQSAAVHRWHRRRARPYVVSPRGMLDPWALSQSRWKKRIAGYLYENAHLRDAGCLHALCDSELQSIRQVRKRGPVCVIPNGVSLPPDQPESSVDICASRDHSLSGGEGYRIRKSTGPQRVLFLGRLHPKKGLSNLLLAWKRCRVATVTEPDSQLLIAGWDQAGHEEELKRLCRDLNLSFANVSANDFLAGRRSDSVSHSVVFLGPVFGHVKDELFRLADAFVLPSFSEGLPMAVLEAWAYRLPVMMTPHCNLPEGFAADAAMSIDPNVESIARSLDMLFGMTDTDLADMGQRGRRLVESRFAWPKVADEMSAVYRWLVGGGERPESVVNA